MQRLTTTKAGNFNDDDHGQTSKTDFLILDHLAAYTVSESPPGETVVRRLGDDTTLVRKVNVYFFIQTINNINKPKNNYLSITRKYENSSILCFSFTQNFFHSSPFES